jgi:hypothetical protein
MEPRSEQAPTPVAGLGRCGCRAGEFKLSVESNREPIVEQEDLSGEPGINDSDSELESMVGAVRQFATEHPGATLLAATALGFLLGRTIFRKS